MTMEFLIQVTVFMPLPRLGRASSAALLVACVCACARLTVATYVPFDNDSLKAAVDKCLLAVPSGEACCSTDANCADPSLARCGVAGCVDMPDWDLIFTFLFCLFFRSHFARAHMAWGARVALRRPSRNRLKIGVRRESTVSNQLLESQRLTRTDD